MENIVSCKDCSNFYRITSEEKTEISKLLRKHREKFKSCLGVCLCKEYKSNSLIKIILFKEDISCIFFKPGYPIENLEIQCPKCKIGNLVVSRNNSWNNSCPISFACNRTQHCSYSTNQAELNLKCRFCGSKLFITSGRIITLSCPKCGKPVKLPITPRIYPRIAYPRGGCSHKQTMIYCQTCDESRRFRKSLLELEIDSLESLLSEPWIRRRRSPSPKEGQLYKRLKKISRF